MSWESVIGLEIHCQLATQSKIFSAAGTTFGVEPNRQACAVDLGFPGVLPVLNGEAVRMAVKFGLATDAEIGRESIFARKNYFYPDLPKGYQISQFELPIVSGGHLDIQVDGASAKRIGITRAHLEEDAGKSLHEDYHGQSGIDLNRAGTPLIEIVSEPDMRSAAEAVAYMRKIHVLVRYLGISDGNMQEGSFRCDANVSVRRAGQDEFGTRAEIKNLNSFRFIEKAIDYEIDRQIDILEGGGEIVQETRLYDADLGETRAMRGKEEANDYRYFPDPDLLPVVLDEAYITALKQELPELPDAKKARFMSHYGLGEAEAAYLTQSRETADYFENTVSATDNNPRTCAIWIMGELAGLLKRSGHGMDENPVSPGHLGALIARIEDNTISGKIAKQVFEVMFREGGTADEIIAAKGLKQVTDSAEIESLVDAAITANPSQAAEFRAGKEKLMGFFVGQVMKASKGKANPAQVNALLRRKLTG